MGNRAEDCSEIMEDVIRSQETEQKTPSFVYSRPLLESPGEEAHGCFLYKMLLNKNKTQMKQSVLGSVAMFLNCDIII